MADGNVETIKTGIEVLDTLVSGEKRRGILTDSTVLLRGGPGTGKTTLALQMIRGHIARDKNVAVLVSLEEEPSRVLEYANKTFNFKIAFKDGQRTKGGGTRVATAVVRRETIEEKILDLLPDYEKDKGSEVEAVGEAISDAIGDAITSQLNIPAGHQPSRQTLIVIDSLNGLASVVLRGMRMKNPSQTVDLRDALWVIWSSIKRFPRRAVTVFTGEYDPPNERSMSVASESYFCDIDIQLSFEAVVRETATEHIPSDFVQEDEWWSYPGRRKGVEKRFFCRVVKSRSGPRQLRRCAYDIVDGHGLRFYETYPGDGQIMLFAENEPQRREWKDFIMHDVLQMYLYPALDYSIFDRSGLQRTFTSLRRFLYIPEATDMYLSSFDTYWVNWYVELCQRLCIVEELRREKLHCDNRTNPGLYRMFCQIVGKVHRACVECPRDRKKQKKFFATAAKKTIKDVCRDQDCDNYSRCATDVENIFKGMISRAYDNVMRAEKRAGLLHLVEKKDIHLFGERKSNVIKELKKRYVVGDKKMLAVPYNANVSFVVYRKDLLQHLRGGIKVDDFAERVKSVFDHLENASRDAGFSSGNRRNVQAVVNRLAESFQKNSAYVPETWEEVIALCELGSGLLGRRLQFLIETRTFDSFACTMLEVVWSTGKDIRVFPDYSVDKKDEVCAVLFKAYYLLYLMFKKGIIPRDSCLEPEEFAAQSSTAQSEWLFARHWYSTLIDVLTAKRQRAVGDHELIWKPDPAVRLDIMPIPLFLLHYADQSPAGGTSAQDEAVTEVSHRACWGEWYLGIMRGTENETLAVDLINNLMSSRKVCDRASSCAALPTVWEFYEMYENARCFNVPERAHKLLPDKTYNDIRKIFAHAKSRTDIFDFRHCMRELHSVLEYVRISEKISAGDLMDKVRKAISRIESLSKKEILVGGPVEV